MATKKFDVYQMVVDRIVSEMEKGIIPWQKPWVSMGGCVNHVTGKPYSPVNCFLLGEMGEYVTCKQCNELGGTVKKGAKARFVVFNKKYTYKVTEHNEEGEEVEVEKERFVLRYYNVFHINDCEGLSPKWDLEVRQSDLELNEKAESIVVEYDKREEGLTIKRYEESPEAFFSPLRDLIVVPMLSQYENLGEYYSTLYHEMVHSTGVKSRCDRGLGTLAAHGKKEYSAEELVAEIGSAMLVNRAGLDASKSFRNSVGYLQSWLRALKNDKKLILVAAARAEKAVKYILNED